LKQETVSGSGISWAIYGPADAYMQGCTSLQTDNQASTQPLSFYRRDAGPAAYSNNPRNHQRQNKARSSAVIAEYHLI